MLSQILLNASSAPLEMLGYLLGGTGLFATGGIVGFKFRLKTLEKEMKENKADMRETKREIKDHLLGHSKIESAITKIETEYKNIYKTLNRIESKL